MTLIWCRSSKSSLKSGQSTKLSRKVRKTIVVQKTTMAMRESEVKVNKRKFSIN